MDTWQVLMAIGVGIGLSAACGFRVFVPLLAIGLAKRAGSSYIPDAGFGWVDSDLALIVLAAATAVEIGAYYIPWLDNALDSIATPAATVAGTLVMVGMLDGMPTPLQWGVGIVGGGGSALSVQGLTVLTRGASTVATAGLGNPLVSTTENIGSTLLSVVAVVLGPLVVVAVIAGIFYLALRLLRRVGALGARGKLTAAQPVALGAMDDPAGGGGEGTPPRRPRRRASRFLKSKGAVALRGPSR